MWELLNAFGVGPWAVAGAVASATAAAWWALHVDTARDTPAMVVHVDGARARIDCGGLVVPQTQTAPPHR